MILAERTENTKEHGLTVEQIELDKLKPFKGNPRRGNVEEIVKSLHANGQYKPITVNRGNKTKRRNEILAGNHTWQAAKQLAWPTIDAVFVDVDDETARRIVLVDNRTNDLASYDNTELLALLESVTDLDGTGYDPDDLYKLLHEVNPVEPDFDEVEDQTRLDEMAAQFCPNCSVELTVKNGKIMEPE